MGLRESFEHEIDKANTLEELVRLETKIRRSKLSEKDKHYLISIVIGRKKRELGTEEEIYLAEVNEMLRTLPVDDSFREILRSYFTRFAREKYVLKTLRKDRLPTIRDFIEWVSNRLKRGGKVKVEDLDISFLKPDHILDFLYEMYPSEVTRYNRRSLILSFGEYLEKSGYISRFPEPYVKKPEKRRTPTGEEEFEGIPRKPSEIKRLLEALATPTSGLAAWKVEMYVLFARTLLQTGLRYRHILNTWRVNDLAETVVEVEDVVFGGKFYRIPARMLLARERKKRGERVTEFKQPADFVFISEDLYEALLDYARRRGLEPDDYLFSEPDRNIQARAVTVRKMTGISNFTFYDFRATFASALFNILGHTDKAKEVVRRRGGWGIYSAIPFRHYIELMTVDDAITIVKTYRIFIEPEYADDVKMILEGKKPEVEPEEVEEIKAKVEARDEEIRRLMEEYESLKRRVEEIKKYLDEILKFRR